MNILSKILSGGASQLISSVGGVIDNLTLSKEEKLELSNKLTEEINRHDEATQLAAQKEIDAYLADTQNARGENTKIQESANASWLAKNVAYILDLTFIAAFLTMLAIIFYRVVPEENKELFYMGFGSLLSYVGTILVFHRGTSQGSKDKSEAIKKLMK